MPRILILASPAIMFASAGRAARAVARSAHPAARRAQPHAAAWATAAPDARGIHSSAAAAAYKAPLKDVAFLANDV